jgi:hypothetical protein
MFLVDGVDWHEEPWHSEIVATAKNGGVVSVTAGERGWVILPNGEVELKSAADLGWWLSLGIEEYANDPS